MKIFFIGQKGLPSKSGGVEKHVEELAVRLVNRGHEVFAYTRPHYSDSKQSEYKGIKLISLTSLKTKNLDAITHTFFACLDVLRRDADIIHFHSIGPSSLIWLVRLLKPKATVIATFHCQDYFHQKWSIIARAYLKFGEWMACRLADRTITVSKTLQAYASSRYGRFVDYIPNGVPEAELKSADKISQLWQLTENSFVLAVSRLVRHKGLHHLINAFKQVDTDKKLIIAGEGAFTDDYVEEIKALAATDDRIQLVGAQHGDVLKELLTNAALFVQPSESEGLSIALLEAMSYGKTALVSDILENLEAIANTGISFTSQDVCDLAQKLRENLAHPSKLEALGKAAQIRAREQYNWETIATATEKVYTESLAEKASMRKRMPKLATRFTNFF